MTIILLYRLGISAEGQVVLLGFNMLGVFINVSSKWE